MSETGFLAHTLPKTQDFRSETRFLVCILRMVQHLIATNFNLFDSE